MSLARALGDPLLDMRTFMAGMIKLGANFGVDYTFDGERITPDGVKARALFETLREKEWTITEFTKRMIEFRSEQRFATWTEADFFKGDRPKVHPRQWYLDRVHESQANNKLIGVYLIPGAERVENGLRTTSFDQRVYGWKHECDGKLLSGVMERKPEPAQLRDPREAMNDETREQLLSIIGKGRGEIEREQELSDRIERLNEENKALVETINRLEAIHRSDLWDINEAKSYIKNASPSDRQYSNDDPLSDWIHYFGMDMRELGQNDITTQSREEAA